MPPKDICVLPIVVANEETLVRVIKDPMHLNKKNKSVLEKAAFRSKSGRDDVSVMRFTYMGIDACHAKALEMFVNSETVSYAGLAALKAHHVRAADSNVVDSRELFCGHADIVHGFVLQPNEPLSPERSMRLDEITRAAEFHRISDPKSEHWSGSVVT